MRKFSITTAGTVVLLSALGCRQDMHNQPKFYPQRGTTFYQDGRSARPQIENTVGRSQLHDDTYFYSGMQNGAEGNALPFKVTPDVMAKGQEKYNVFCTPCHSRVGNGAGMIVSRGYAKAGNFHTARLLNAPLGHFFSVITNGYGAMPDYASQITPEDRWAIVAYVKALQLSQNASQDDIAAGQHPEPLSEISTREGFAANFAAEWALPPTAVTGTGTDENYILPVGSNSSGMGASNSPQQPAQISAPVGSGAHGVPGPGSSGYGSGIASPGTSHSPSTATPPGK